MSGQNSKITLKQAEWVFDQADLLDPQSEAALSAKLKEAEEQFGPQLVVVTVKSLDGKTIEQFSTDLGNAWGIGDSKRDDGLILLVAPNERNVRIAVGYGLEGSFNDPYCAKIIKEIILPHFQSGNFKQGIFDGVEQLIEKMKAVPTLTTYDNSDEEILDKAA